MTISSFSVANAETRLLHLNQRIENDEPGSNDAFRHATLPQYGSTLEQLNAHLRARRDDEKGNADRRDTLIGNAILVYLRDGGSRERLAEILDSVPPDEHLHDFFKDEDPKHPRNRLTELLKKVPIVELP